LCGGYEKEGAVKISVMCLCAVGVMLTATGCGKGTRQAASTIPPELATLAAQFKAAPPTDRIALGEQLIHVLPTCKQPAGPDGVERLDWNKPSYHLYAPDTEALLGEPAERGEGYLVYALGSDAKTQRALLVEFHNNYVSIGRIDVSRKPR